MRFPAISRVFASGGLSLICVFTMLALAGCEGMDADSFNWNHGLFDQSELAVTTKTKSPLLVPILDKLNTGIDEPSDEVANATDVQPQDLVANATDYTVGPGDALTVVINDLQQVGTQETETKRVSETGNISLPMIGLVQVSGYTEAQLEQLIANKYQDQGFLKNAVVSVTVTEGRGRTFSINGSVQQIGQYAIPKADFRILDAITLAHGLTVATDPRGAEGIEYVYVIRSAASEAAAANATTNPTTAPAAGAAAAGGTTPNPAEALAPTPPGQTTSQAAPTTPAAPETTTASTAPTTAAASEGEGHYVIVDGKPVLVNGPGGSSAAAAGAAPTTEPSAAPTTQGFAFNDLKQPTDQRIIRVPIGALMLGDLRYNIVIRPDDVIQVNPMVQGEYYMGGHVQRVGVYNLTGRMITLTQGVISAGMLDQLAVPGRCEIRRRVADDKTVIARVNLEKIFAGQEPDIYLKPDDQVLVGSNALAPFLAASRGAYRLTYGFGFLYDRNYAPQNTQGG